MTCFHWFARAGAIICGVGLISMPALLQGQIVRDTAEGVGEFGRDAIGATGDAARDTVRGATRAAEGTARGVRRGVRDADNRVGRGPVRDTVRAATGGALRGTRRGLGLAFDERAVNEIAIGNIESGSVAYRAGLRQGDRIVSINDREFDSYDKANTYLDGYTGQDLDFVVQRDGRELEFTANVPTRQLADPPALGVTFDEETDDLVITRVERGSPADRAGLLTGDQLVSLDDRRLTSYRQVRRILADVDRDSPVSIGLLREGRRVYLEANLGGRRNSEARVARRTERRVEREPAREVVSRPSLGVIFDHRDDELIVSRVERNSPAYRSGLRRGDLIVSLDGRRVRNFREVTRYLARLEADDNVDIGIWRDGRDISLDARLAASEEVFDRDSGDRDARDQDTADRDERRQGDRYAEDQANYERDSYAERRREHRESTQDDRDARREARRDEDRRFDGRREDESSSHDHDDSARDEKDGDRKDDSNADDDSDDRREEDKDDSKGHDDEEDSDRRKTEKDEGSSSDSDDH